MESTRKLTEPFIELVRVENGYMVRGPRREYDKGYVPFVVFPSKVELCEWLVNNWDDKPVEWM